MKRLVVCIPALVAFAVAGFVSGKQEPSGQGWFEGELELQRVEDPFIPTYSLLQELRFHQPEGRIWVTPVGATVDGRAVPKLFLELFGPPLDSHYRKSAVTYDYAVKSKHHPWKIAQRMFYEAVRSEGVEPADAKVMYMLLRATGTRWAVQGPGNCFSRCHGPGAKLEWRPRVLDDEVMGLVDWVRTDNPSLSDIEQSVGAVIIDAGPHSTVPIR